MEDSHITEASDKLEIGSSDNNSLSVSEDNILNENSSSETRVSGKVNKLTAKDITSTYAKTLTFSVKVTGSNGVILKNKPVTFKVVGKTYSVNSDDNGRAAIKLKLNAGKYKVTFSCENISGSNILTVKNAYKITVYKWKSGADVKKNRKIKSHILILS